MIREIEVLFVEDCPNFPILLARIEAVTYGRANVRTTRVDLGGPVPTAFAGSPTMLVDGRNPFGGPRVTSVSCVLRIPSIEELKALLDR